MAVYDVVIIGAEPVGENVADRVVAGGLSAAIVERELAGGECSYWACMPTKALLRSGVRGPDVAELIHAATIAIAAAVPIDRL
jgi:pyruvate/2-oxoglutarate dehydrogenase complex dihydrolipoamide dehydrogenase (E3) component